jgi:murein L,D-transpeptidase YafK
MRSTLLPLSLIVRRLGAAAFVASASVMLAACEEAATGTNAGLARASHPVSPEMAALMQKKGVLPNAPVLIRTFKKEAEFEVWKMKPDGRYTLLRTYPMCRWSGQLGPKVREGDRQVPEGFYKITPGQMNPNSNYYLSFNVGYPNAYDRAWGHEGGSIMVHGACSSSGCFSMTDRQIDEIYALARDGFAGGQQAIQMQSYPFHMTAENMAKYRLDPNIAFWKQLKEGADHFEVTQQDVRAGVCAKHYVFDAVLADGSHLEAMEPCPPLKRDPGVEADVAAKQKQDEAKAAELVAAGLPAIRTIYADGGQNQAFAAANLADVSRPEAIAAGPADWLVEPKGKKVSPVVKVAGAKAAVKAAKESAAKAGKDPAAAHAAYASSGPSAAASQSPAAKKTETWTASPDDHAAAAAPTAANPQLQAPAGEGEGGVASLAGKTADWSSNLTAALFAK